MLKNLLASKTIAVSILNTKKLDQLIYYMNDTCKEFLQYDQHELNQVTLKAIIHKDDLHSSTQMLHKLLNSELKEYTAERRYVRKDGSEFWGLLTLKWLDDTFILWTIQDIQEKKDIEEAFINFIHQGSVNRISSEDSFEHPTMDSELSIGPKSNRKYFRISLKCPICSELRILREGKGSMATSSSTNICIKDIGPGGLKFKSDLKLPVDSQLTLEFNFQLLGIKFNLRGKVVRAVTKKGYYQYGVRFYIDEKNRALLARTCNNVAILYRNRIALYDTHLCEKSCD